MTRIDHALTLAAALSWLLLAGPAAAETLEMPDKRPLVSESTPESPLPGRGMSMEAVRAEFGEPQERLPAVGGYSAIRPPITRWVYEDFTVHFENRSVIHAVRHHPVKSDP